MQSEDEYSAHISGLDVLSEHETKGADIARTLRKYTAVKLSSNHRQIKRASRSNHSTIHPPLSKDLDLGNRILLSQIEVCELMRRIHVVMHASGR